MFGSLFQRMRDTVKNSVKHVGAQEPFQKADLGEVAQELVGPDRGWFQIFPFVLGEESGLEVVESCLLPGERLALVIFDIRKYAEMELPKEALEQMREVLSFFVEKRKDIILRVAYDRDGKAMEREPSLFQKVSRHMEQIAALVAQFGEAVFVYQGLLIGNWGEMHGSRYLDERHMASLAALLRDQIRGEVFLAVRTPAQWRLMEQAGQTGRVRQTGRDELAGRESWPGQNGQSEKVHQGLLAGREKLAGKSDNAGAAQGDGSLQMGLFNDAILGSETDRGTYSLDARQREEELFLVEQITEHTPSGGEVVLGEGYLDSLTQEEILCRLSQMHLTYLNRQHDIQVIEKWRNMPYSGRGVFAGKSLYDYIGAHLGYRFLVQDAWIESGTTSRENGQTGGPKLHIRLQNLGFAPIYRKTRSEMIWEDASGKRGSIPVEMDLRALKDAKPYDMSFPMKNMENPENLEKIVHPCKLWLITKRSYDGEVIRFANWQTEDGSVLLGEW